MAVGFEDIASTCPHQPEPCDDASSNEILLTEQFIEFYYQQFDTDRKSLSSLYVSKARQPLI